MPAGSRRDRRRLTATGLALALAVTAVGCTEATDGGGGRSTASDPIASPVTSGPAASAVPATGQVPRDPGTTTGRTTPGTSKAPARTLPDGWSPAAPANEDLRRRDQLDLLGQQVVMAFDGDGAPVVAYTELVDSGGGNYALLVVRWDPGERAWSAPREIFRGPLAGRPSGRTLNMASDPSTGLLAIALEDQTDGGISSSGIDLLFSTNGGADWRRTAVTGEDGAAHPALVAHDGRIDIAWLSEREGVIVSSGGPVTEGMEWRRQAVPQVRANLTSRAAPSIAISAGGTVGVAYVLAPEVGARHLVAYWAVGGGEPVVAFDSEGRADDAPGVALAYTGDTALVAASLHRRSGDAPVWVARATPTGFAPPEAVTGDGTADADGVSLAVTSASLAHTVFAPVDKLVIGACGLPKIARSADGAPWQTCGPPATDRVWPNDLPVAVAGPDGRLYVPVANRNPDSAQPAGVLVWRQPAA